MTPDELVDVEIRLLLEGVFAVYGYDFRDYAHASVRRRVLQAASSAQRKSVSALQDRVLRDPAAFAELLRHLMIPTTAMFRDPEFFAALRAEVLPYLTTFPSVKVWSAGCSTGQESYSLAILLAEEGLLERTLIYATDINKAGLEIADKGIYPAAALQEYTENYQRTSPRGALSDYYRVEYGNALFARRLRERIVFAEHSLVSDAVFSEVHLVVCRNVLIYFAPVLQKRALGLFLESLTPRGYLALGSRESLQFSGHERRFEAVDRSWKIFRKLAD